MAITMLGDMHFMMIVADDSKVYIMDPLYDPTHGYAYAGYNNVGHGTLI